ncbi:MULTISPECIES: IS30 family transposase [Brevibacterium]|nr:MULTISPECIES: IS30 family transposase [Brevibacterium]
MPGSELFRQVTPGATGAVAPADAFEYESVVGPRAAAAPGSLREEMGDRVPQVVCDHSASRHAASVSTLATYIKETRPSRELARNATITLGYLPYTAHRMATSRRPRPRVRKLEAESRLRSYIQGKLSKKWSPEQISHRLVKDFPDDEGMRVCTETIYQSIYVQGHGGLGREIAALMRRGRAVRKPRRDPAHRTKRFVDEMASIADRPPEADDRAIPGHWEGDLIIGTKSRSAIATLVERSSRFVTLVRLAHDHTAETVRDGLVKTVSELPQTLRRSLTWDQCTEMSGHVAFHTATNMDVYFCDPGSPWQRGSNENTNGLLRQYFPKGTDLSRHAPMELEDVAAELNARPRKSLNWETPGERLRALLEPQ